jgi:transposase
MEFHRRNKYPEIIYKVFNVLPEEGQRVVVDYGNSTNENIWFIEGKFVNIYGFEMYGVLGWKPYEK